MRVDKIMRASLALAVVVLPIIALGFAVPGFYVNPQGIGSGSQTLVSPVPQGSIWFSPTLTTGELVFPVDLPNGTSIYVSLLNSTGAVVAYNYSIVLTSNLTAGTVLQYELSNPTGATRAEVVKAIVTISIPTYQSSFSSGRILITSQGIGVGFANTTVFCTPITINETSGETLYNYSALIVLDDSQNTNSETWKVDWNVINDTNLYFTDSSGNPFYFWVQYMNTTDRIAYIWVKLPELEANSSETICLNYGVWPNPYRDYQNLYRTFLFVDDFFIFNSTAWNSNGPVNVINGVLELQRGEWIWTKRTFGEHYAVHFSAYLNPEDGTEFNNAPNTNRVYYSLGPFFMGYIDQNNVTYAEGVGGRYLFGDKFAEAKGPLNFILPYDPDITGYWSASRTNTQYDWQNWIYVTMTLYNGQLEFYKKAPDGDWGNISTYTLMSSYGITVNGSGRIGLGQWSGGPSYYGWVVVRNYVNPEPKVSVGLWYYKLIFYPQPSATAGATAQSSSVSALSFQLLPAILNTLNKPLPIEDEGIQKSVAVTIQEPIRIAESIERKGRPKEKSSRG